MKTIHGSLLAAVAATLLFAPAAHAQEGDHVRFRGGIALEAGLLMPPGATLGAFGPRGELGVQINNLVGIYAVPGFDILAGSASGVNIYGAVLVDFTLLDDRLTVGAGPDVGSFFALGSGGGGAAGGAEGVRVHVGWNAILGKGERGGRRKALTVGLDLRGLVGPSASATVSNGMLTSASASNNGFVFSPMLSVGYTAF